MSQLAIEVKHLGKRYRLGQLQAYRTLRESIQHWVQSPLRRLRRGSRPGLEIGSGPDVIDALKDVSLDVERGEVLGIIGHNGAGKSTLLKILSRITEPSEGFARIHGRVSSLLEVGTGFHPELTGRENVFLNGSILGMQKAEIKRKFSDIVEFSGVERFLNTPVKRYSSGMQVRLAFAVAAHLEPEILVIDEVLAVGDADFQRRCLGKMQDVAQSGRTVLFVSHNLAAVEALCSRAVLLSSGSVECTGSPTHVIQQYMSRAVKSATDVSLLEHPNREEGSVRMMRRIRLTDDQHNALPVVELGRPITFELAIEHDVPLAGASIAMHIYDLFGKRVVSCNSAYQTNISFDGVTSGIVRCRMPSCQLLPGTYSLLLSIRSLPNFVDRIDPALEFEVLPRDIYGTGKTPPTKDGTYAPETDWTITSA